MAKKSKFEIEVIDKVKELRLKKNLTQERYSYVSECFPRIYRSD